jgi:uncharacterized protein
LATNETFDIAGPAGRLEAILMHPDGPPRAAAVVCHADPTQGGVMHFKVVFRAAKALQTEGIAALRFNFRGVGRSEGEHDHGRGEQDDVRAAVAEVQRRFPGLPIVVGGFSFGSLMALHVGCADPNVRAVFALGCPLARITDKAFLETCTKPRLFVQGANDVFGPADKIRDFVAPLPEPKSLTIVPDADHFFGGHLDELQETVRAWAATHPWETA